MNVFWITAIFLLRSLTAAASTGDCFNCIDMTIHRITTNDRMSVSCPNVTGTEVKFQLRREQGGKKSVIGTVIKKPNDTMREDTVDFLDQNPNQTARFILSQLSANDTGIYTCNAELLYPPPYTTAPGAHNMVIVDEVTPQDKQCPSVKAPQVWIWVALGLVMAYSLIITGLAVGFWHNQINKQSLQHDYMNMKPRALRKKQGVQHPVRTGRY